MKRFALSSTIQFKGNESRAHLPWKKIHLGVALICLFSSTAKKYEISVRVLAGEGDGTLIYLDNHGVLHVVGGGDPRIDREKVQAATKQIEAGAAAYAEATPGLRA